MFNIYFCSFVGDFTISGEHIDEMEYMDDLDEENIDEEDDEKVFLTLIHNTYDV